MKTIKAPCFRQDTPLWFWEVFCAGPFLLTDDAWLDVYETGDYSPN